MRIVIATGGTGGHLFPAFQVAEELKRSGHAILFLGAFRRAQEQMRASGFAFEELGTKGFVTSSLSKAFGSMIAMVQGIFKACGCLRRFKPDAVLGFGGYGAFPAVASAILLRYPAMIHEQNAVPGRANKILAKFVKKIAISFPAAARYFNEHKTVLTGCPCRLSQRPMDRAAIVRAFGLKDNKTTIFVFGGSQGSHSINEAFAACVPSLREILDFQAIHVSGKDDYLSLKDRYNEFGIPFALFDFLDKMEEAYHIADVVISRSGAATVSELAHFRLPSILIPYPHAQGHQRENASVLCQAGLAQMIEERDVTVSKMSEAILRILKDGKNINRKFDQICFPDAAQRLAREVTGLAQ